MTTVVDPRNGYDERRVWYVTPGDDDGEPTGDHVECSSLAEAEVEAEKMAARYGGVEVVTS